MWYAYTKEYYSAIKKKEIFPFATTWMDLDSIMPKNIKSEKDKHCKYHLIVESKK